MLYIRNQTVRAYYGSHNAEAVTGELAKENVR